MTNPNVNVTLECDGDLVSKCDCPVKVHVKSFHTFVQTGPVFFNLFTTLLLDNPLNDPYLL